MQTSQLFKLKYTALASLCAGLAACGGGSTTVDESDPNAVVAEEAEARLDRVAPTLTVTAPTSSGSMTTTQKAVVLSGSASDNRQVSRVTWVSDSGASGRATQSSSSDRVNWSSGSISLPNGKHRITVRAYDRAGNVASQAVSITVAADGAVPAPAPADPTPAAPTPAASTPAAPAPPAATPAAPAPAAPTPAAPAPAPTTAGTPSGLPVTATMIPTGSRGIANTPTYSGGAPAAGDGTGAFRTSCEFSHMNFDDPIVFPGVSNGSHLHTFFGNTSTNAGTNLLDLRSVGNSTCRGGTMNRSAYWVPSIIDTRNGRPIAPAVGGINGMPETTMYYKTGYNIPRSDYPKIVLPPLGFRMIAGDSKATGAQSNRAVEWSCANGSASSSGSTSIPLCKTGDAVNVLLHFPQCWDGVNLDSPDHRSHVTYPPDQGSCPASHPVPLPAISYNIYYEVQAGDDVSAWKLSTDMYTSGPGGYSMHGDWVNGWDPAISSIWIKNCLNSPHDCGGGNLGDGRELDYVWPLLAPRQAR